MYSKQRFAMGLATVMLVAALAGATAGTASAAPTGDLSVDVTQDGDGGAATVTVTANGSAIEGANVSVVALNNSSYAGTGTYVTDGNGTVGLTAPAENVTVEVTAEAGNATGAATATLTATTSNETRESFGDEMAAYVHKMISVRDRASPGGEVSGDSLGQLVSQYATEHNPGAEKRPDHAGPPGDRGRDGGDGERGQDDDRGHGNDRGGQGQGHADGARGNGTGGGPPWQ